MLCPVADQQQVGHGLRQPEESQPRGGPGDGQAEGQAFGEAGVLHGGSAGARQQLLLTRLQKSQKVYLNMKEVFSGSLNYYFIN